MRKIYSRALSLEPIWAKAAHSLKCLPDVLDIRTIWLTAAIDLAGKPRFETMNHAFHTQDLLLRIAGDCLILTPP